MWCVDRVDQSMFGALKSSSRMSLLVKREDETMRLEDKSSIDTMSMKE